MAMLPIISAVTREYKITEEVLVQEGQSPTPLQARRVCAWLAERLGIRLSPGEIGKALGRDRYAVFRGVAIIEQRRRDDAWLREMTDRLLTELSAA
jgi:chromosomal replication initiation ATPase DnaA